jgi:hypothetical protein
MTSIQRTTVMFAVLWLALAVWQAVHTMRVCFDASVTGILQWSAQFTLLGVPLIVLRRDAATNRNTPHVRDALAVIVLSYVPVTLALRIAEACAQH